MARDETILLDIACAARLIVEFRHGMQLEKRRLLLQKSKRRLLLFGRLPK